MPSNFNNYNIDDEFTNKAWIDMQDRLDKALPVKKPFFLSKWLGLAAIFCLLGIGACWLTSQNNTQRLLENTIEKNVYSANNSSININNSTPVTSLNDETLLNIEETKEAKNELSTIKKSLIRDTQNTQSTQNNNLINSPKKIKQNNDIKKGNEIIEKASIKKEKTPATKLDKTTNDNATFQSTSIKKLFKPTQKLAEIEQNIANAKTVTTLTNKLKNVSTKPTLKNLVSLKKSIQPIDKTKLRSTNQTKAIKYLSTISSYLEKTTLFTEEYPSINQLNDVLVNNGELNTQKNDDVWPFSKALQFGLKQGFSSNLSTESTIFAGAFVNFKLNKQWFVEFAPVYQFGALNQKNEVQYELSIAVADSRDGNPDNIENFGEEDVYPTPPINAPSPENIPSTESESVVPDLTKDTVFTTLKTNRHYLAADLLVGYQISPKVETLLGVSVARSFMNASKANKNSNDSVSYLEALSATKPILYNRWSVAPKFTLRFALKPQLSLETFYAHQLIPLVKKEYQLDKTTLDSTNSNPYLSNTFGLGFIYKFK